LRLAVVGRPGWVDGPLKDLLDRRTAPLCEAGLLARVEIIDYEREEDRFGGEEGARIAERIFHHDTEACIDWLDAEARGRTERSRREHCLIMTERYLDLMHLTREKRIAFYRHSYSFEVDLGRWQADEIDKIERHYRSIREGLLDLFVGETSRDPAALWGGDEPASIARSCIDAIRPLADELLLARGEGGCRRNRIDLAWSLTHMHANRLQVEADAEAIVRYFMCRLHQEEDIVP
jgi:thiopeptide-type bacteriocin biosynthesis protein